MLQVFVEDMDIEGGDVEHAVGSPCMWRLGVRLVTHTARAAWRPAFLHYPACMQVAW